MTTYLIIRQDPIYDEGEGIYRHHNNPVLIIRNVNEDKIKTFIDNANQTMQLYKEELIKKKLHNFNNERVIEEIKLNPPWTEIVRVVGPKPNYDHSLQADREYNDIHKEKVDAWRNMFKNWAKEHEDEWIDRVLQLAAEKMAELKSTNIDLSHSIYKNMPEEIVRYSSSRVWWSSLASYYLPYFEYSEIEEGTLDS